MAWIRATGSPDMNAGNIIKNGTLNSNYYLSGTLVQDTDCVKITRSGGLNGGEIAPIDYTGYNTLTVQLQGVAGAETQLYIDGSQKFRASADTAIHIYTVDVSALTGVKQTSFILSTDNTSAKIFNMTLS